MLLVIEIYFALACQALSNSVIKTVQMDAATARCMMVDLSLRAWS